MRRKNNQSFESSQKELDEKSLFYIDTVGFYQ